MTHGTPGFILAYVLALAGFLAAVRSQRLPLASVLPAALAVNFLALLAAAFLGDIVYDLTQHWTATVLRPLVALSGPATLLLTGFAIGLIYVHGAPRTQLYRGTQLLTEHLRQRDLAPGSPVQTLAGIPIAASDETKHFKLLGTTGTGKSTAIRELLRGALARGDRAVIADPDGGYLRTFYDAVRGDVILSPFDPRAHRWDLMAEIVQLHDADQLARSIIPDYEGTDRSWRHYARTFLTAVLRQLHRAGGHDLAKLYYLLILAPQAELRELIGGTPAGSFLGEASDGSSHARKFFESVRAVTNAHAAALEHVAAQQTGDLLSIRRWIREGSGVLFLPYRASEIEVLRYLVSTWMRLAIFETMSAEEGDQRLWFLVDELDALGAIDGLKDALARLRKFGGRCILAFQSIGQVRGIYGDAEARTIVENCGNTLICAAPRARTAAPPSSPPAWSASARSSVPTTP